MTNEKTTEAKMLFWMRATAIGVLAVLVVIFFITMQLGQQINALTEQLNAPELQDTLETLSELDYEQAFDGLNEATRQLAIVSRQLADIDWNGLETNINNTAIEAQNSMQAALEAIDSIDLVKLNKAIADLQAVIEPLANLVRKFG